MADHHDAPSYIDPEHSSLENYTGSELPYRALYISMVVLFVVSVLFAIALVPMRDAFIAMADRASEGEIVPSDVRPAASRLQQSPEGDWKVWEGLMEERLTSYGWQDEASGIARIPVDRAIALALEEGLIQSTPDAQALVYPSSEESEPAAHAGADAEDGSAHGDTAAAEEGAH